jgi:hypothetical protein
MTSEHRQVNRAGLEREAQLLAEEHPEQAMPRCGSCSPTTVSTALYAFR